jgi:LmbE family N-acetylglucosaminyl deacetylase
VLCVQPHYDDNDLGAGGTIAALSDAGARIAYLTVTDDLVGVRDASLSDAAARERLRDDQRRAAAEIGVHEQHWLDLPDAGPWDAFALRGRVIEHIRRFRPDFVLTVDPWLPREAHPDHLKTGRACAEAVMLHRFPRLRTLPEVDAAYRPYEIAGLALYFTRAPNTVFDVGATRARKHRAIDAYTTQLDAEELAFLHRGLEGMERHWARDEGFEYGEALQVLHPGQLHVDLVG